MLTDVFLLGATGFVGDATVGAALEAGLSVGAWARTEAQAQVLRRRGVQVTAPPQIPPTKVVVDLIQPKLPDRLSEAALARAARYRVDVTRSVLPALPRGALLFSVSGTDDFEGGIVSHRSRLTTRPSTRSGPTARSSCSLSPAVTSTWCCSVRSTCCFRSRWRSSSARGSAGGCAGYHG